MPFASLKLIPGVNAEKTLSQNEAGISRSNLIRFRDGLVEKLGGWTRFYPFNLSGIPRALHAWQDLNSNDHLAIGTTLNLNIISNGSLQQITPQKFLSNAAPNFSTTSGSPVVSIVDPNISTITTFDSVFFNTPVSVGGLVLSGLYPVTLSLSTTSYQITAAQNATATVSNGGSVPAFNTVSGDATVTVTLNAHGCAIGDIVVFSIATNVGGITIQGRYSITNVINANQFTISASNQANATASATMNGGNVQFLYDITLGPAPAATGYGIGAYGAGGYGTGSVSPAQRGTPITASDWSLDNWGEILIANPEGGSLYYWMPRSGLENGAIVSEGPVFNNGAFVAMPAQILVAWGSSIAHRIGIEQDPLLVRWSDQLNFLEWTVTITTQAGSFRIPRGSKIMGGRQASRRGLIWTDLALWAMNYLGPPLVFGFDEIGVNCGLVGKHAHVEFGDVVYWMGQSNFFYIGGGGTSAVSPLPCSVWDAVFEDLDRSNAYKSFAVSNTPFNEVWFFYPSLSGGTGECDKYVKFNTLEKIWDYGTLSRSAFIDQSVLGMPIGATKDGVLYSHETSRDGDGLPLNSFFETGAFMIGEGEDMSFVDMILPDMKWGPFNGPQNASLQITLKSYKYPGDAPRVHGPYTFTQAKRYINTRLRGRQMTIRIESNDLGSVWRLGRIRFRFSPDGRTP